jgi:hypothetical protein
LAKVHHNAAERPKWRNPIAFFADLDPLAPLATSAWDVKPTPDETPTGFGFTYNKFSCGFSHRHIIAMTMDKGTYRKK